MKAKTMSFFIVLSIIFMYINFFGFQVETIPLLLFFTLLFNTIVLFSSNELITVNKADYDMIFFIFILIVFGIFNIFINGLTSIISLGKYLFGPLCYFMFKKYYTYFNKRSFSILIFFIFILTILIIFKIPLIRSILEMVISRLDFNSGFRGISVLTPEPSYFALFSMLFLCLVEYYDQINAISNKLKYILLGIVLLLSLVSLSVYSLLVILVYLFIKCLFKNPLLILFILLSITLLVLYPDFLPKNRIKQIFTSINKLFTANVSLIDFLFIVEPSGSTRIILNFIGMVSIIFHPFGSGFNSFQDTFLTISNILKLPIENHEVLKYLIGTKFYAQTYIANLANDIGLLSLVVIKIYFSNYNNYYSKEFKVIIIFFFLLMLFFQCQITNPIPWFILAIVKSKEFTR